MDSWFWFCWISLLTLFRNISSDPASPLRYTLHHNPVNFDVALHHCSPGVLTSLSTEQELSEVLRLVTESAPSLHQNQFTFWVGLRKVKKGCVDPDLPLRGFKWTEDGSQDTQVSRWAKEPEQTCTSILCAALKGELNGSTVAQWGLIPISCSHKHQFICKLRNRETSITPKPESEQVTPEPEPDTPEPEPPVPTPTKPELPKLEPKLPTQGPNPETFLTTETELQKSDGSGSDPSPTPVHGPAPAPGPDPSPGSDPAPDPAHGSAPAPGSDSCKRPDINGTRWFREGDTKSRIVVECWSSAPVELVCSGRPAEWRLLDDSPANFSTVCVPCEKGFQKNASGICVDVDECSGGAPCRHMCLNTVGSFSCFCSDENGKQHDEASSECAAMTGRILIPVLVAVAALVVLVVVIAVTVKCCLMRRSKKRAMKKAEKMAMESKEGKDSFGTANEKVAT